MQRLYVVAEVVSWSWELCGFYIPLDIRSSWKYVPQMIKDEIDGNNSPNQLDISESQIQEEINNLINSTICNE